MPPAPAPFPATSSMASAKTSTLDANGGDDERTQFLLSVGANGKPAQNVGSSEVTVSGARTSQRTVASIQKARSPSSGGCIPDMVRNEKFTLLVGVVIMLNTVSMAIETDYGAYVILWKIVNNLFLVFFVFEIVVRLLTFRGGFFCPVGHEMWGWNMFDLTIVLLSVIDLWVKDIIIANLIPSSTAAGHNPMARYVMILRMFRILRILRVLRLFQSFGQLMALVNGIIDSMQLVIWIMLMLFMLMFVVAIFMTDTIGMKADHFPLHVQSDIEIYWGGVIKSLNTFFQFLTLDNWSFIMSEVTHTMPAMTIFFDIYIFVAAFTMLSLLTGVIAEHMGEVSQQLRDDEENKKKELIVHFIDSLQRQRPDLVAFSFTDLEDLFKNPEVQSELEKFNVAVGANEMHNLWDFLDMDLDGSVAWDELKSGLVRLHGDLQPGDLLRMRRAAERVARRLVPEMSPDVCKQKLQEVLTFMDDVELRLGELSDQMVEFMHIDK